MQQERLGRTSLMLGERALVTLYNGTATDTLDQLHYQRFCVRVAPCATSVQIQCLLPTSTAAKYHSLWVYLQVQVIFKDHSLISFFLN